MTELKDVADEFTDLEDVFFPKDKSKCYHIVSGELLIPVVENGERVGCIMECANPICKELQRVACDTCAVGQTLRDKQTGELVTMLPCDAEEMKRKYPNEYE